MIAVVAVLSFLAGLSALMAVMAVIEPDTAASQATAPVAARADAPMEAEPAVARAAA